MSKCWEAWSWLDARVDNSDLERYPFWFEFDQKHPEIFQEFASAFGQSDKDEAGILYGLARIFGGYNQDNGISIAEGIYINGRHRTRIAQSQGIKIPIFYKTYRRLKPK